MSDIVQPSFVRADSVETSTAGDRVVLYHRRSKRALVLNPTGSWIWSLLSDPMSLDGLVLAVEQRYPGVSADQARHDVKALLEELQSHQMLVDRS